MGGVNGEVRGKKIIAYIAYIVYKSPLHIEHMFDIIHTVLPYTVGG
jgi:hypothetical protein